MAKSIKNYILMHKNTAVSVAHNCFTPYKIANYLNVVIEFKTKGEGDNFIMQTQPGFIHSLTDFYESDAGLIITETTIGGFSAYDAKATPEFLRIRKAVQYAEELDSFVTYLWVGDINKQEIMRLEMGLKFYKDGRTSNGAFAGFNAPLDPGIRGSRISEGIRNGPHFYNEGI